MVLSGMVESQYLDGFGLPLGPLNNDPVPRVRSGSAARRVAPRESAGEQTVRRVRFVPSRDVILCEPASAGRGQVVDQDDPRTPSPRRRWLTAQS